MSTAKNGGAITNQLTLILISGLAKSMQKMKTGSYYYF